MYFRFSQPSLANTVFVYQMYSRWSQQELLANRHSLIAFGNPHCLTLTVCKHRPRLHIPIQRMLLLRHVLTHVLPYRSFSAGYIPFLIYHVQYALCFVVSLVVETVQAFALQKCFIDFIELFYKAKMLYIICLKMFLNNRQLLLHITSDTHDRVKAAM